MFPVALYGCKTLSLKLRKERKLRVFENRMLRRIFWPERDYKIGDVRKSHNEEPRYLYISLIHSFINGYTALCWVLPLSHNVSFVIFLTQTVGLLGRVISPSQGRYLNKGQHKHTINGHNIHSLSGIRTHDPSVRASEVRSCFRPPGHCDRQHVHFTKYN
jgi:hypothetical protein